MVATKRDPRVQIAPAYAATKRKTRSPRHPFQLRVQPFQIQPFMLAPVLPGETMKNLLLQARVVTDPIVHPLIGWWSEFYYFYVKLIDMDGKDDFMAMFANNTALPGGYSTAADPLYYHWANGVNWTKLAMQPVVRHFFRDEGEDWDVQTLNGLPLAQIVGQNWMDSLTLAASYTNRDVNLDLDADSKVEASEVLRGIDQWQALRDAGLMDMDYEDYIATYGERVREVETSPELNVPELIRYCKNWSYPSNTIDPADGTPRSAVSWSVAERADKDRRFKHPGFILGLTVTRPKVYIGGQTGSLAHAMNTALEWLPAVLHDHPELSRMQFADNTGPVDFTDTGGYWVDVKDLFLHGDQFLNYAIDASSSKVSLPVAATAQRRYPLSADIDALFVNAAGGKKYVRMDGVTSLNILGRQYEVTPNTSM